MESFRTELENIENPVIRKDIVDLERKIRLFREGKIDDDKFRSLRLVRGIYGQRQPGVQMIRIKIPLGKITTRQIRRIADIAEEYGSGNLHATTRQDIQIHFVSLDKTPELWTKLEQDQITTREACGNTVRNITASHLAGIDPKEPFDVTPYAYEMFQYFLRNPVCQEMGRKFKIAFSSSESDDAYTFIHDLGFIPVVKDNVHGFKVVLGGGLGANPYLAQPVFDFLPQDRIIPFTESVLRVFDRFGERTRRMKARLKFLIDEIGLEEFMKLVKEEELALKYKSYSIDGSNLYAPAYDQKPGVPNSRVDVGDNAKFQKWANTNTVAQKQNGYHAVHVKLPLGNMSSALARQFADVADLFTPGELRITINQGYQLRFVREADLPSLFNALDALGLAEPGFDSTGDVTACPGTESCNLAISDSTHISLALERVIAEEYPDLIYNTDIKIKISGCPNSCGQHGLAGIGFHGSTIKDKSGNVIPALVVLLGGGNLGGGNGIISEKVIKIPSKRGPAALRLILNDYEQNAQEGEYYHSYYARKGRPYFYTLLKGLTDLTTINPEDYIDWGENHNFVLHTAVGECAGVIIDLIATLFLESEEKLALSKENLENNMYADSIYHSYSAFINTAKALLLTKDIKPSTQYQVLNDFEKSFGSQDGFSFAASFKEYVLQINKHQPTAEFAANYRAGSALFLQEAIEYRSTYKEINSNEAYSELT